MKIDKNKLDILIAEQGLTAKALAIRAGITPSTISQYWYGKSARHATAIKIAKALGVAVGDILLKD